MKKIVRLLVALMVTLCFSSGLLQTVHVVAQDEAKDSLVLAIGSEPEEGFDPVTGWGRYGTPLFHSTLIKYGRDFKVVNDLAESYSVNNAQTEWTFKIKEGILFSDGSPLTVEDVKFTFDTVKEKSAHFNLEKVTAIDVKDGSVVFTLTEPDSTFLNTISTIGIFAQKHYDDKYGEKPIGTGPYQLVEWKKGEQLIVEQNPHYYGEASQFKKLTFLFLEEGAALAAALTQEIDVVAISNTNANVEVPNMTLHALQSVDNRGVALPYVPEEEIDGRKVGNNVTADKAIRQAMNIAINREEIAKQVLNGYGKPAYSVADHMPWWNEASVLADNDLDKAKEILEAGGWQLNADGILEKDGLKAEFPLLYPSSDTTREALAHIFSESVAPLGIKVNVEGKGWDQLEKEMYSNAMLFGWGNNTPLEMYYLFSSSTKGYEYYNNNYYGNPKVDEYFKQALAATSEEEANKYWQLAQWDGEAGFATSEGDVPWIWIVNLDHLYLVNDKLDIGEQRIQPHGHGWPLTEFLTEWKVK
ncbi:ABC transporter substrate-binding protein [Aerococcaceae bacterium NML191292]|nr:ABC transporter substrate-binding protein [Aerococcaceae bacterium NML191292]MCW6660961.1 ABC transporter substrate-binding protein [Aerococcaceae bacterium NML201209]MCW6679850.1 ABC transporter substrate-binding protein [Aerococcaceae bacterium NML130460]MCW6681742.1 ABC transporter substrate-binding protein [Aerococcaceae bacterium NML160702]